MRSACYADTSDIHAPRCAGSCSCFLLCTHARFGKSRIVVSIRSCAQLPAFNDYAIATRVPYQLKSVSQRCGE
jgi:hypothetical protein